MKWVQNAVVTIKLREYGERQMRWLEDFSLQGEDDVAAQLTVSAAEKSHLLTADIRCQGEPYDYFKVLDPECAVKVSYTMGDMPFRALAIAKMDPFWTKPVFLSGETEEKVVHIQQLLLEAAGEYFHVMPLADENGICELAYDPKDRSFQLTGGNYRAGSPWFRQNMAVISKDSDPYKAVEKSFGTAVQQGLITTPLREGKTFPEQLEGLGWCTWNAFYHQVTEMGILEKLEEFREKGVMPDWIIIDDGWAQTGEFKLRSFVEDREKFPSGFRAFISRIKKEYGIKYVGLWHAFTGYWFGIERDSEVYRQQGANLEENAAGLILPGGTYEKAYSFYSAWHSYLKDQGIDFLKVDAQGNAFEFWCGQPGCTEKVTAMHRALEQSVEEHFGNGLINCMGLGNMDVYHRQSTSVLRSSGDFFPDRENGFQTHIEQNVYNSIFLGQLYHCDYDMWWTKHISAGQSSILRRISGGPVYVSDRVGDTRGEYLDAFRTEEEKSIRFEQPARPTYDCVFGYDKVLKVYNTTGDKIVVAAFNLSDEECQVTIRPEDVGLYGGAQRQIKVKSGEVQLIWFSEEGGYRYEQS